jgi:succinyl-diaminopimelate desuccinylase
VNIGVIKGGAKRNIVPGTCEVEVDMRLPLGITYDEMEKKIEQKLLEIDPTIIFDFPHIEPDRMFLDNYTDPKEKIIETVHKNSTEVTGREPLLSFTPAITDCRYFRKRNIPSLNYGPKGYNIAAADENVTVDDLITVTKVYAGTIIDFLNT